MVKDTHVPALQRKCRWKQPGSPAQEHKLCAMVPSNGLGSSQVFNFRKSNYVTEKDSQANPSMTSKEAVAKQHIHSING